VSKRIIKGEFEEDLTTQAQVRKMFIPPHSIAGRGEARKGNRRTPETIQPFRQKKADVQMAEANKKTGR